jgi:hypothetical protein
MYAPRLGDHAVDGAAPEGVVAPTAVWNRFCFMLATLNGRGLDEK